MKKLIVLLAFAGSSAWGMTNLPDGVYQGQGRWNDNKGVTGTYDVGTAIQSDIMSSTYIFGSNSESVTMEAKIDANGNFDVVIAGSKVGEGYCLSVQCHYSVTFADGKTVEETLTFVDKNLYRIGSKRIADQLITWEEALVKQE